MSPSENLVLASLNEEDLNLVTDRLELVELPVAYVLYEPGDSVDRVFFPVSGLISSVLVAPDGRQQEVGIYGRDGFGSFSVLFGSQTSNFRHLVQTAGRAYTISTRDLRSACAERPNLHAALLKFPHVFSLQVAHTAFSNGNSTIEERLARWLVMCRDRVESNSLTLTHEFLSVMLAVRRPSVTQAIHMLEARQFIRASRGSIQILDRMGLERLAGFTYGVPEREHAELIGSWSGRISEHSPTAAFS